MIAIEAQENRLCELIDGILVEKTKGFDESLIAAEIIALLKDFIKRHDLGLVTAPDGMIRLAPGQVRIPDVCFFAKPRLPKHRGPRPAIPDDTPDLAIEVLSKGNTKREMDRKIREYFNAGVRLVWLIDPRKRTACAYDSPTRMIKLDETQALDGGGVLPGFRLPLAMLFVCIKRTCKYLFINGCEVLITNQESLFSRNVASLILFILREKTIPDSNRKKFQLSRIVLTLRYVSTIFDVAC